MYEIGTLMVNLATKSAAGRAVRAQGVVLEADSEKTLRELERRQPQVRDRIIAVVREQTAESIAGNDGQDRLRESLVRSVNELCGGRSRSSLVHRLVVQ